MSRVPVVGNDLLRYDSSTVSWVEVGFGSFTILVLVGKVVWDLLVGLLGLTDGPPYDNFFLISSFSLRRASISSSFIFFISVISLCRDISNVICSASDILSFVMFPSRFHLIFSSFKFSWSHSGRQLFSNRLGLRELLPSSSIGRSSPASSSPY